MEKYVLFTLGERAVTLFSLCVALAAALGMLLMGREQKKQGLRADTTEIFSLLALPLCLIGGRLVYCLCNFRLYLYELGVGRVLYLWDGGYAMLGLGLGAALAAWSTGKITRQAPARILDMIAAPSALIIALCRFAEGFSGQGFGREVEQTFFQRFPFAIYHGDWELWFWAVFMLEGVVACLIALALQSKRIPKSPGSKAKLFLILLCASQTFLEMLREDGYMRLDPWFIRITQLGALLVLIGLMIAAVKHWKHLPAKQRISGTSVGVLWALFLILTGVDVWMQFAIQKSAELPVWACYTVMGACSLGFGLLAYRMVFKHAVNVK